MNDIQGHWAQNCIEILAQQGIVAGYPDGTFRPEQPVTRAEFATLIIKSFPRNPNRPATAFTDVPGTYWAAAAIEEAYVTGWLTGYPANRFKPNLPIPRAQAMVALVSGFGYLAERSTEATLNQLFVDSGAIAAYARDKIAAAVEQQLVINYPDIQQFRPNKPAIRGEIAAFLCQALARQANQPSPIALGYIATLPHAEIRGAWLTNIDSEVLFSRSALTAALDRLAEHNFNTVYLTVWNWGYTLYPSEVAVRAFGYKQGLYPAIENQGRDDAAEALQGDRDMLLEAIELASVRNLSVIPWFEFGLMAPEDSPLARRNPTWITRRADGTHIDYQDNGKHARVWLNPFHPEVQQFLVDLVSELSANYDIEGFQIDDHFGLPVAFGYDPATTALYQQATGRQPPANAEDTLWMRWRADQITQLVERLFRAMKRHRPRAVFSVSPSPAGFAYGNYLQDWPAWERAGYVEELLVQIYRRSLSIFASELTKPVLRAARDRIPTAIGILSGLRQNSVSSTLVKDQVLESRQQGFAGVSFFYYESIWQAENESVAAREAMVRSLFPAPKPRPAAPEA